MLHVAVATRAFRRYSTYRAATLAGVLEATVAMSALAHEPERWEALLRSLVSS